MADKARTLAQWHDASHRWTERAKELLAELRGLAKRCGGGGAGLLARVLRRHWMDGLIWRYRLRSARLAHTRPRPRPGPLACRHAAEPECTVHIAMAKQHIAAAASLPAAVAKELERLAEAAKPYCLCKQLYDEARPMLGCDYCQEVRGSAAQLGAAQRAAAGLSWAARPAGCFTRAPAC